MKCGEKPRLVDDQHLAVIAAEDDIAVIEPALPESAFHKIPNAVSGHAQHGQFGAAGQSRHNRTVAVEPSTNGHPHSEDQKEEEGAAQVKEEEKMEAQEQKEGILAESLMAKVILYTPY